MSESIHGEPVGFTPPAVPDHLTHLDTGEANQLIDYVLTEVRPVEHTTARTLNGVLLGGLAVALAVIVLMMFRRNDEYLTVALAASAGGIAVTAGCQFSSARLGRRATHVTAVIAAYETRLIEHDGQVNP
jgi:hypothetical protein